MPKGDTFTKEQCMGWRDMCRDRAAELRAAGDIKHAERFEEGAQGWDLALAKKDRRLSIMQSKSRRVKGIHGNVGRAERKNVFRDAILKAVENTASIDQVWETVCRVTGNSYPRLKITQHLYRLKYDGIIEQPEASKFRLIIPEQKTK